MKNTESDDYDSPWKEILEHYFQEFTEFFFPKAFHEIDWTKGYKFLDKELQQVTKDAQETRRYVDKLAQVWLKNGTEEWALIHTDIQNQHEKNFNERMYIYNYRFYDRFRRHVASFAVLGDSSKKWKPDTFEKSLWGCEIRFKFPIVKLADYKNKEKELDESNNPFAIVVLAHLKTKDTKNDKTRRRVEKLAIIKHLYQKGYTRQDIINLFRFIDWIMSLPKKDEKLFWQELEVYEKEGKMPYVTSVERIGFERGMQQGMQQQGIQIISKQISKKFKSKVEKELAWIKKLNSDDLQELGELILDFESLNEVHEWIQKRVQA